MEFEWDRRKDVLDRQRHKVSFGEAVTVFGDPLSTTVPDPDHSSAEERYIIIGVSDRGRLLMVAHAERGARLRIISARELTSTERAQYEAGCS